MTNKDEAKKVDKSTNKAKKTKKTASSNKSTTNKNGYVVGTVHPNSKYVGVST